MNLKANSSLNLATVPLQQGVTYRRQSGGRVRLQNRELITTVMGTPHWECLSFEVNPGRIESFPWLSQWATCFDVYRLHQFSVLYTPIAAATTASEVGIAFDYHVTDPKPASLLEFTQTWLVYTGPSYVSARLDIDCSKFNYSKYFTRASGMSLMETADVGNILLTTSGASGAHLGRLWVEYDVELLEPQSRQADPVTEIGYPFEDAVSSYPGPAVSPTLWPSTVSNWTNLVPLNAVIKGVTAYLDPTQAGWINVPAGIPHGLLNVYTKGEVNNNTPGLSYTSSSEDTYCIPEFRNCAVERRSKAYDTVGPWSTSVVGKAVQSYLLTAASSQAEMGFLPKMLSTLANTCTSLVPYIWFQTLTPKQYQKLRSEL